ncbi:MAG: hypothetical protein JWP66_1824 [Naasia sp.]|nr:hypothetical protein [Naasia sp.]
MLALSFLVVLQVFSLPGDIADDVRRPPESAHLLWPMLAVAEPEVLCFQVVIVCTWRPLGTVKRDRICSDASLAWVTRIVWSFVAGWLLFASLAAYLTAVISVTPGQRVPGIPLMLFGMVRPGAVLVLLVVVLRLSSARRRRCAPTWRRSFDADRGADRWGVG